MESDTSALPPQGRWDGLDPHPLYGRVAHTYGHGIDMPLSVIRMGYADHPAGLGCNTWDAFAEHCAEPVPACSPDLRRSDALAETR